MGYRQNGSWFSARRGWLAVSWTAGGRSRTFAPNAWVCLFVAAVVPVLALWYLCATLYFVFHDQMVASLIGRQTDMEYAYEDRITELRTALDRETSRGLMDRQTLATAVHDLTERSQLLESHAAAIDRLVARNAKLPASAKPANSVNPLLAADPGPSNARAFDGPAPGPFPATPVSSDRLHLKAAPDYPAPPPVPAAPEQRSDLGLPDLSPGVNIAQADLAQVKPSQPELADALTRIERTQDHTLSALREPALRTVSKLRAALTGSGLGLKLANVSIKLVAGETGGPFVPLPATTGASGFDQTVSLVDDALTQAERLETLADKVPLRHPIDGPLEVTSPFGARLDPFYGRPAMHTGIDFREGYGDGVRATAAGTVTIAGSDGGYGTMVEIDHGNGLSTRYAHLSRVSVVPNQKVKAGDIVGHAGSSGRATGPHLHYETRINGEAVNPLRFLNAGAQLSED